MYQMGNSTKILFHSPTSISFSIHSTALSPFSHTSVICKKKESLNDKNLNCLSLSSCLTFLKFPQITSFNYCLHTLHFTLFTLHTHPLRTMGHLFFLCVCIFFSLYMSMYKFHSTMWPCSF